MKKILCAVAVAVASCALSLSAATFKGYDCTDDCSGHRAGYLWAQRKNIIDPKHCQNIINSGKRSFGEGCMAWVDGK